MGDLKSVGKRHFLGKRVLTHLSRPDCSSLYLEVSKHAQFNDVLHSPWIKVVQVHVVEIQILPATATLNVAIWKGGRPVKSPWDFGRKFWEQSRWMWRSVQTPTFYTSFDSVWKTATDMFHSQNSIRSKVGCGQRSQSKNFEFSNNSESKNLRGSEILDLNTHCSSHL